MNTGFESTFCDTVISHETKQLYLLSAGSGVQIASGTLQNGSSPKGGDPFFAPQWAA